MKEKPYKEAMESLPHVKWATENWLAKRGYKATVIAYEDRGPFIKVDIHGVPGYTPLNVQEELRETLTAIVPQFIRVSVGFVLRGGAG